MDATNTIVSINYLAENPKTGEKKNLLNVSIGASGEGAQQTSVNASKEVPNNIVRKAFRYAEALLENLEKDFSKVKEEKVTDTRDKKEKIMVAFQSTGRKRPGRKGLPLEFKQGMIKFVEARLLENKAWNSIVQEWNEVHEENQYVNLRSMQAAFYKAKKDLSQIAA